MADAYVAKPRVEIDGTALSDDIEVLVEHAVVDDDLRLPDTFALMFRDPTRTVFERARVRIGSEVRILASPVGAEEEHELIVGDVTALEADYGGSGSHALVRGYDRSHRLARGRRTETYRNVTDADIARTIARRAHLDVGQIDEAQTTHQQVSQVNLNDWDFLRARATEIGYEAAISGGKLYFRRPAQARAGPEEGDYESNDPLQLVFGSNLQSFRPRLSSSGQVGEVEVRGWDATRKEALVSRAEASTVGVSIRDTPSELSSTFGQWVHTSVNRAFSQQGEVDAAAAALAERIGRGFAAADGSARGDPRLRAGAAVSIALTGAAFDGRYVLTSTSHRFDRHGYRTRFTIGGRQGQTLLGLISPGLAGGPASGAGAPVLGVVTAMVTGVDDPDELGRVKVKFPWLSDDYESDWARVVQFGAGDGRGAVFLPEVNDEVLVAFEHGEMRRPYVVGGLYNGVDRPTLGDSIVAADGAVERRGFVSRKRHRLVFVDSDSDAKIEVDAQGDVIIHATGKLELRARSGVTIDAGGGSVKVSGSTIELN